jgi:hypothetical protein
MIRKHRKRRKNDTFGQKSISRLFFGGGGGGPGAEIGKKSDFDPKCAKKKTIELFDADLN